MQSDHWIGKVTQKALLIRDGKMLMTLEVSPSEWNLPGGRLHQGEALPAGLIREVKEELGLAIEVGELISAGMVPYGNDLPAVGLFYDAKLVNPGQEMVLDTEEIAEARWVSLAELGSLNMIEGIEPHIRRAFALGVGR